jgi:hypothetical protein
MLSGFKVADFEARIAGNGAAAPILRELELDWLGVGCPL